MTVTLSVGFGQVWGAGNNSNKWDTVICAGDYLIVLTSKDRAAKINDTLIKMVSSSEMRKEV
jgi:hypothetical protein